MTHEPNLARSARPGLLAAAPAHGFLVPSLPRSSGLQTTSSYGTGFLGKRSGWMGVWVWVVGSNLALLSHFKLERSTR